MGISASSSNGAAKSNIVRRPPVMTEFVIPTFAAVRMEKFYFAMIAGAEKPPFSTGIVTCGVFSVLMGSVSASLVIQSVA